MYNNENIFRQLIINSSCTIGYKIENLQSNVNMRFHILKHFVLFAIYTK